MLVWGQAITWTNDDLLSIRSLVTNFSNIWVKIYQFSFKEMLLKMLSAKHQTYFSGINVLTHWGWVMHICINKPTIIGSDNGLSPGRRQAIIKTNAGILLIPTLGTNFSEILIKILTFSFKKMHLKVSSAKWRPFCLSLNVIMAFCRQSPWGCWLVM